MTSSGLTIVTTTPSFVFATTDNKVDDSEQPVASTSKEEGEDGDNKNNGDNDDDDSNTDNGDGSNTLASIQGLTKDETEVNCDNGKDDDGDGATDSDDGDCGKDTVQGGLGSEEAPPPPAPLVNVSPPAPLVNVSPIESPEAGVVEVACDNGKDDDGDGAIDSDDPDCAETVEIIPFKEQELSKPNGTTIVTNKTDIVPFKQQELSNPNLSKEQVLFPEPNGTLLAPEPDERAKEVNCEDGKDNDRDGLIDGQDEGDCPPDIIVK